MYDGSTAALMKQMYKHLEDGRTTAQALQLAMLHLLNGPADSRWRRPLYWAAFLVVGANTRLPGVSARVDTLEGPCEGPAGKKPSESAKKKKPKKKNVTIKMKRGAGEAEEAEEAEEEAEEEEEGATACV